MQHRYISCSFADVPIGAEFWWGGFTPERCNWGRKRSSATADYRPRLSGKLTSWTEWCYWRQREQVYVLAEAQP
jgi:hypothetical protein